MLVEATAGPSTPLRSGRDDNFVAKRAVAFCACFPVLRVFPQPAKPVPFREPIAFVKMHDVFSRPFRDCLQLCARYPGLASWATFTPSLSGRTPSATPKREELRRLSFRIK